MLSSLVFVLRHRYVIIVSRYIVSLFAQIIASIILSMYISYLMSESWYHAPPDTLCAAICYIGEIS